MELSICGVEGHVPKLCKVSGSVQLKDQKKENCVISEMGTYTI